MPTLPREEETLPLPLQGRRSALGGTPRGPIRYRVLGEIARGGMGAVFRTHDPELGRILAMKVLLEEHAADPDMQARFLEEARITSRLQHPGIVPIHDIGRLADGRPFFTMKLVEGRTLAGLLGSRTSPVDELPRMLAAFEQTCQAIAYAHSRGVLHRDLKPANIMVGAFGEVQVMDWGVAKVVRPEDSRDHAGDTSILPPPLTPSLFEQTLAGAVVGTPAYMAPEQARAEPLDERSDVFGLGAILCEILTGRPPFSILPGSSVYLLAQDRDLSEAHDRLEGCHADRELVALARACLAEHRADRPANAGVVVSRLAGHRAGVEKRLRQADIDRAAADARLQAARAKSRARRMAAVLLGAMLLAVGLIVGGGWWVRTQRQALIVHVETLLEGSARAAEQARSLPEDQGLERLREAAGLADQAWEVAQGDLAGSELRARADAERTRLRGEIHDREDDRQLVEALAEIRLKKEDDYERSEADASYSRVFAAHGIALDEGTLKQLAVAIRLRRRSLLPAIVAALDDWSGERRREGKTAEAWQRPMRLAALIDADPWRNRLREWMLSAPPVVGAAAAIPGVAGVPLMVAGLEHDLRRVRLVELAQASDRLDPASAQLLASLLRQERLGREAVTLLRTVQRRHPGDVWVNHDLARMLEGESPLESVRFYTAARAVRPEVGHSLAHVLITLNRNEEAAELFAEMARLRPRNATHHNCLGSALQNLGKVAEARLAYEEALRLSPNMHQALFNLGRMDVRQKQPARGLERLDRSIAASPSYGSAHCWRGKANLALGRPALAEADFRRALELNTRDYEARFELALLVEKRDPRLGAELYRILLMFHPDNYEARANLGKLLADMGQPEQGLPELQRAVKESPRDAIIRVMLGNVLQKLRRYEEAATHFREAAKLDPRNYQAASGLGVALIDLRQYSESGMWFEKATELDPKCATHPYNRGNSWLVQNRLEDAILWYDKALSLSPAYPEALCNKGHALRRLGRLKESLDSLRKGHDAGRRRKDWRYPSGAWVKDGELLARAEAWLPDLLAGATAAVDLRFAATEVARLKGRHSDRAILLQQVLAEAPYLTVDRASCAEAALAAARSARTPEAAARWRGQAHSWLREALARRSGMREMWRNPVFAPVRDESALAGLPDHERAAWERLWNAVRAALPDEA